ncbi:ABC transporter substrate-binding protein [Actinomadura chibensis]|uniref:Sugar ABC transporter substrate-binding protein n=1 Tax=Actinomadura chibensis TaxID=392828 RepID=A0A5D0NCA5_9ACTN|nr:sugar ABC transporter substrate-binding protein [Actinomadura chibensis]TYB41891.1 sugar ABC transporter substrate-binding protein [Actinomadura chibensis]
MATSPERTAPGGPRVGRRTILTAGAAGAASALLAAAGCATGGGVKKAGPTLTAGGSAAVKGTVGVWSWDVAAKALKRLAPSFERRHPAARVEVVDIGYDNAYDKITVGLKSGKGLPDVLTVEGSRLPGYIGVFPGGLYDLTSLAARHRTRFAPAAWKDVTDENGRVFALPWDAGPCALYYRTDMFESAGIAPNSLATWDDYVRAGERIKSATGKKLLVMDPQEDSLFPMLLQQQGQRYVRNGEIVVADRQAVRAATLLKTLADKDLIAFETGWDGLIAATKAGKVATTPYAVWWSGTLTDEMKELKGKFGVVPLPAFDPGGVRTSNDGGSTLAVSGRSANASAAWAFVEFVLADAANQVSMLTNEGLFPAYLPALQDPFITAPQPYYGGEPVFKVFADLADAVPPVEDTKDGPKARDIVNRAISGILLHGKDPKAALGSAARQIAAATGRPIAG